MLRSLLCQNTIEACPFVYINMLIWFHIVKNLTRKILIVDESVKQGGEYFPT